MTNSVPSTSTAGEVNGDDLTLKLKLFDDAATAATTAATTAAATSWSVR